MNVQHATQLRIRRVQLLLQLASCPILATSSMSLVCLSACLLVCLPACLPARLSLSVC